MGAQSMRHNSTAHDDSTDSQLDSGSPCYGDSKEALHSRIALIFTRHFYFEGKATKANKGSAMRKVYSLSFNPIITNSFLIIIVS